MNIVHKSSMELLKILNKLGHPTYELNGKHYQWGLEGINHFLDFLGNPQMKFPIIHITGTNGKGTVGAMISSALINMGYNVGSYNSPHILSYHERIKCNGFPITQSYTKEFCVIYLRYANIYPTKLNSYSEVLVALAFWYFAKIQVDLAVIEVGIGGELDPTNVSCNKLLTILTSLGYAHTELFGHDIKRIIKSKLGICRPTVPLVLGQIEKDYYQYVEEYMPSDVPVIYCSNHSISEFNFSNINACDFKGPYQSQNLLTGLVSLHQISIILNFEITDSRIFQGLCNAKMKMGHHGRFEILSSIPYIVSDVCSNSFGLKLTIEHLYNLSKKESKRFILIIGISSIRKQDIFSLIPSEAIIFFTEEKGFLTAKEMKKLSQRNGIVTKNIEDAIHQYLEISTENDIVFIGGTYWIGVEAFKLKRLFANKI